MQFTIRTKLLLLSFALLSIPYVGYEYLRETESLLRQGLESSLLAAARTHAAALHERSDLFPIHTGAAPPVGTLFVHNLSHEIQLDGYADDWYSYLEWSPSYAHSSKLAAVGAGLDPIMSFRLTLGSHDDYLFGFVEVRDEKIVYSPNHQLSGDRVDLVFTDAHDRLRTYSFSTAAPGRLNPVERVLNRDGDYVTRAVTNVSATWQPSETGFNLELAIPMHLVGRQLGLLVADVDKADTRELIATAATAGVQTRNRPGLLLRPSSEVQKLLMSAGYSDGRRVWVLDGHGQVLASGGRLDRSRKAHPMNALYAFILPSPAENFMDDLASASHLQGQEVLAALSGSAAPRWRATANNRAIIVSAGHPVWVDGVVRGAVMVEETTNSIQTLQRAAMASLFNKTIIVLALVTLLLLAFAARLSTRLRRLSVEANAAIDPYGRVVAEIAGSNASDEIGDVSRQLSAMLARLRQYNDYLEKMAGRLAHELRTPMAVVRSSIENLETGVENDSAYLARAHDGIKRLELLVIRLGEASRLEGALADAERSPVELRSLVLGCVDGYRSAYPSNIFETKSEVRISNVYGNPDLMVQLLDKLIANAVDFADPAQPVEVHLQTRERSIALRVTNYGSSLPDSLSGDLFNSMISVRNDGNREEPHLGLGLYIVR